nr:hypothetical protein [Tanacetum cinerariifolium]
TLKAYGTVVDVYIPYKKSKAGKHFAFIRFIKATGREVPSLVLDDTCFSDRDFNLSFMGKVKDITALPNLYVILEEEGFQIFKISYLGGMWVFSELESSTASQKFIKHAEVGSWFSSLQPASNSFVSDERIVWISIEGLPLKVWSFNTFVKVASKWGELVEWKNIEDNNFSRRRIEIPQGFTPKETSVNEVHEKEMEAPSEEVKQNSYNSVKNNSLNASYYSQRFKACGSIIDLMDELVMVGQTIGYNMDRLGHKTKKGWIKELSSFFSAALFGSSNQQHQLLPGSTNIFTGSKLTKKRMLWDYLLSLINRWDGECVIMGDFNEVRLEHERYGSVFNVQSAVEFNNFISLASLIDLPLDGYAYTWVHKSATKLSKLEWFLISKGLIASFPHLSAMYLDKHLSDHRPILTREMNIDYGPTPFRFFHSWFQIDGFDKLVEDTWMHMDITDSNGMILLKKKLQALKIIIREWTKNAKKCSYKKKSSIQSKLSNIDKIIDQGGSTEMILNDRSILLKELHDIICIDLEEMVQKAKYWKFLENDISISVMEFFSSGVFTGIPLDNSLTISHLIYADDAIFIGKWDLSNLKIILKVLRCFHMASGLKININKSKLMGYGVHSDEVETVARYIGCATFVAPFSHLKIKVGGRMERINSWDDVVSKVTSRLSKWKLKTLSIGGRLTLIKLELTSIPLYQMFSFKVPIKVLKILKSIRRKFFNGIERNERKLALLSWDIVLASKKYGGLGVSSFFAMNRALLSK